jgi:hypothetical protein
MRAFHDAFQRTDLDSLRRLFWHDDDANFFGRRTTSSCSDGSRSIVLSSASAPSIITSSSSMRWAICYGPLAEPVSKPWLWQPMRP